MTDLNTLIPADSPWLLLEALGNNDRGQIVGYGFRTDVGEVHAYVATPSHGSNKVALAMPSINERPKVVLPENVRKLLHQRRGFERLRNGPMNP